MREYKFRAWDGREMFNVDVLAISPCTWDCPDHGRRGVSLAYQPHIKVMQFTGLFDKNGVEIYGGDIVRIKGGRQHGVVAYNGKEFGLFDDKGIFYVGYKWEEWQRFEVIGNIHENPEATP